MTGRLYTLINVSRFARRWTTATCCSHSSSRLQNCRPVSSWNSTCRVMGTTLCDPPELRDVLRPRELDRPDVEDQCSVRERLRVNRSGLSSEKLAPSVSDDPEPVLCDELSVSD